MRYSEPHSDPDMAEEIDKPEEIMAEVFGVPVATAKRILDYYELRSKRDQEEMAAMMISRIVGQLCRPGVNLPALVHSLALAAGLDSLNGIKTQSEVARKLGCTRALISHYVCAWADLLHLQITKFRKREDTRETFRQSAKAGWETRNKK
jgi:uncharacterized protein with von Willebrand factor type A (vWA) domain